MKTALELMKEDMKTGVQLIAEERARQISSEGWTAAHDAQHHMGEMAEAAICYAQAAQMVGHGLPMHTIQDTPSEWPWDAEWWKPGADRVRNLAKAGALIAAEIDREQRKCRHEDAIQMKNGRGLADS